MFYLLQLFKEFTNTDIKLYLEQYLHIIRHGYLIIRQHYLKVLWSADLTMNDQHIYNFDMYCDLLIYLARSIFLNVICTGSFRPAFSSHDCGKFT